MAFRTKIDYSTNRQISQREKTFTTLHGSSTFGVPFSALTSGPDTDTTIVTDDLSGLSGTTFSGNDTTTIFNFADPRMVLAVNTLSVITPTNYQISQNTGDIFTGLDTTVTVDGNFVTLTYTGVNFTFDVEDFYDLGGGNYSGTAEHSEFFLLSAGTLDFTDRPIWIDNPEITRTDKLIISNGAQAGYILTSDSEGMASWVPSPSGFSGTTIWVSGSGSDSIKSNTTGVIASGDYSLAYGRATTASGANSHAEGSGTIASGNTSHAEGANTIAGGGYSHAEGRNTIASGLNSHAQGLGTIANGDYSTASGYFVTANGDGSYAGGRGVFNDNTKIVANGESSFAHFKYSVDVGSIGAKANFSAILGGVRQDTNGISSGIFAGEGNRILTGANRSVLIGGYENTIDTSAHHSVVIGGTDITATTSHTVYVPDLVIDGLASVTDLQTDANGLIIDGASDISLKTNINELDSALDKIKNLRGVSFDWTPESNMGDGKYFGLIAQEVKEVIPEIVKSRVKHEGHLTLDYKALIPWLVEAIKELAESSNPLFNETLIQTETIASEDNDILLNFNGTHDTALNGGIVVNKGVNENTNSQFIINSEGHWLSNTYIIPHGIVIPEFTPENSSDLNGKIGEITRDDNYLYVKGKDGQWKRSNLETF